VRESASLKACLRLSGILATLVFAVMAVSDLLLLTTLDFHRPYRFWEDAARLPQSQVTVGYMLGMLGIPLHCVTSAWHLSLAVRPVGLWASRLVLVATAYSVSLLAVWHASFAFARSIARAERASGIVSSGPGPEALLAYSTYAVPAFRLALVVAGLAYLLVFGLALSGLTLYPRWAGVVLPATYVLVAFFVMPHLPASLDILRATAWNAGGVALFALSTAILWNRGG
jgi:hypothetical protein